METEQELVKVRGSTLLRAHEQASSQSHEKVGAHLHQHHFQQRNSPSGFLQSLSQVVESDILQGAELLRTSEPTQQGPLLSHHDLHQQMQQRLDQEHLDRTAIQLEAQQRVLDQQQDFLDTQQRILVAVQQQQQPNGSPILQTALQLHQMQQNQQVPSQNQSLMQQMHQQQEVHNQVQTHQLPQQVPLNQLPQHSVELNQFPLQNTVLSGQRVGQVDQSTSGRLRPLESQCNSEQVATSEEATPSRPTEPGQVFGSGTIKQIVYDSLCASNKNENPVTFVNSQGGQITILNNASKVTSTGVPGTVVTIDGKRHFFPSDALPSSTAAADLGDSSALSGPTGAAAMPRAQEEEGLSQHSRDGSQNGAGLQAETDPLPALSCSLSEVQGSQGSHLRNRPDTSQSQHQGEHEPGNSLAEATSRANFAAQLDNGLAQGHQLEASRGGACRAPATRHRSPSPIPSGQIVTATALLATNHTPFGASLGDTIGQGGPAPAFSDANSEGANSWQGYTADGKLFSAPQGGALLNSSQFQGCFQNPGPNSGSQTLIRHPSQPMLQNLPSRPSTPVAILSSDGTVTVTLNGFTSQSIPLIAPNAQSTQMLTAGQGSNSAALSQLLQQHQPPQAQQFGQQQQQLVQDSQMAAQGLQMQQPQIFQNFQTPNLQTQSFHTQNPQEGMQLAPAQYAQLPQGPSYQVAAVQQPGMQGATPVGQGLPAGASLSSQQPAFGAHGGPAGQCQMVQVGGYREVRYAEDESRQAPQQQTAPPQGAQFQARDSRAFALPQLSSAAQLLQPPASHFPHTVSYQYDQETQQFLANQHQLAGMRPQAVQISSQPGPTAAPLPLRIQSQFQSMEQLQGPGPQYLQGSLHQDQALVAPQASSMMPPVQFAESNLLQPAFLSQPTSGQALHQLRAQQQPLQLPLRQNSTPDSSPRGMQAAPLMQSEPAYELRNHQAPMADALQRSVEAPQQLSSLHHSHSMPAFTGQHMLLQKQPSSQHVMHPQEHFNPGPLVAHFEGPSRKRHEGTAHYGGKGESLTAGPQKVITTAYSHTESEEVQSRSGSSTQVAQHEGGKGSQGTGVLSHLQHLQHPIRSGSPAVPSPKTTLPSDSLLSAASQPSRPPLAPTLPPVAFAFVPPTPPFHGTPTTVLPALPRSLQPQGLCAPTSMLRTVSSGVSTAGSLSEGVLSKLNSGHASSNKVGGNAQLNGVPGLRIGGVLRNGSGLRVNYVHDKADALAAAVAVGANNGMELPDFGLGQFDPEGSGRGDALVEKVFREREGKGASEKGGEIDQVLKQAALPEVRLGRSRSGGSDAEPTTAFFSPNTASKNAAKLVETGHVTNAAAGDLGRTTMVLDAGALPKAGGPKLQRTRSLPGVGTGPSQGPESELEAESAFLRAFSRSQVTVAPPLVERSEAPSASRGHTTPETIPPLKNRVGDHPSIQQAHPQMQAQMGASHPAFLIRERGPVQATADTITPRRLPPHLQTGPLVEEVIASPSVEAAQALSFLNDEPDPSFQPQAVKSDQGTTQPAERPDTLAECLQGGEPNLPARTERSEPSPNTPAAPWETASTPQVGGVLKDEASAERKRKWEAGQEPAVSSADVSQGEAQGLADVSEQGPGAVEGSGGGAEKAPAAVDASQGSRPVVHHSRELSLVDGLGLDQVVEEHEGRKVRRVEGRASPDAGVEFGGS